MFLVGVLNVTEVSGAGIEVVPNLPEVSDTDIEVVPNLSKCRVPVSSSYRTIPECSVGIEAISNLTEDVGMVFAEQIHRVYLVLVLVSIKIRTLNHVFLGCLFQP